MSTETRFTSLDLLVPQSLISEELEGLYGSTILAEMGEILNYYNIYERGSDFTSEGTNGDYVASDLKYKLARNLIDKEARFLFSKTPDIIVKVPRKEEGNKELLDEQESKLQNFVDKVLSKNHFSSSLLKAAKDCFIGKRIAVVANFNEESGIQLSFIPSLEFVYDVDSQDANVITKFVAFYMIRDDKLKANQRIYKKKYWLEKGFCWYEENVYDGNGQLVEGVSPKQKTLLREIPVRVIINDGLSGDLLGESEIHQLEEYENYYTRLSNSDIDAERKSMNPTRYTVDMNPSTTQGLSTAAGAFWDLSSDQTLESPSPQVGLLEPTMSYSGVLSSTLNRIKTTMYEQIDVPDLTSDKLQGLVTSGKTIKALYYPLIVRCDEKMLAWRPALEGIISLIIEGSKAYPDIAKKYVEEIPDIEYEVIVENQYPLPEDEAEEKQIDMAEVNNQVMSKKSYMIKWRGLTAVEAEDELEQIAKERELLEDNFSPFGG